MASGAQATLSRQAQELAAENAQIKEELAFLQQLVADSNKQVGLSIQRLTVERESDDAWRYRLLLVRGGSPKDEFTGHATMQVTLQPAAGAAPGLRSDTLSLPDDQPGSGAALMLKFKYYQRVEGTIAVPAGSGDPRGHRPRIRIGTGGSARHPQPCDSVGRSPCGSARSARRRRNESIA